MVRPLVASLTALLAALGLAACGGTSGGDTAELAGDEARVAEVLEDLREAADEDDAERVCQDLLARALSRQLGDRCPEAMQRAFDEADSSNIAVEDVALGRPGQPARARITTDTGGEDEEIVELVREGDAWRISRFAGAPRG